MRILYSVALAIFQLQTPAVDAPGILAAALERLMPTRRPNAWAPTGRANLAERTLLLDVARTTEAFRSIDRAISPDYGKIGRPFVARERAEAIHCSGGANCRVDDDGVYAAIKSVKTDNAVNSYRIVLLLLFNGDSQRGWLTGTETEMFVSRDQLGWKVDRIGRIGAIN
jgi:hypothetical protein